MRLVLGDGASREVADDELPALYPWPKSGRWIRAMMIQTLDGSAIGPDGRSKSISSPADMRVFRETRRLADAVLIGAQTMRAERYTPMRERDGRAPRLVIVSGTLDLPWDEPVWAESAHRPLVLTTTSASPDALRIAEHHVEVAALPMLNPEAIVAALGERDLLRITCEGGPTLLAALSGAGLVDEADIAIAPMLVGGGQITAGEAMGPARMRLAHVLEDDGYLFGRYLAVRPTVAR